MREVARKRYYYSERGVSAEVLDAQALYELEPNLRRGCLVDFLFQATGVVYPPCAASLSL